MQITNKLNLPLPIVNAARNDEYNRGDAHYSVSQLIAPTQQTILANRYESERSEDVSDMVWKLLGKSYHMLMEKHGGKNALTEERLFFEIQGIKIDVPVPDQPTKSYLNYVRKISGCPDWFDGTELWDWKTTKAYARKSRLSEWTKQVNAYRFLLKKYKFDPKKQFILAIYKDWRRSEALKDAGYPQKDIEIIPIDIWSDEKTEAYLKGRLELLVRHENDTDDELAERIPCTAEEMWTRDIKWVVVKKGSVRAIKGGAKDTEEEAKKHMAEQKKPTDHEIVYRPGARARCDGYCPSSEFCSQYMAYKVETGQLDHDEPEAE